jgi:hypothetical protein
MLYHGTHTPERVKGMEWLAFEIEHAENFARGRFGRRPGGPGRPPGEGPGYRPPGDRPPGDGPPPSGWQLDRSSDGVSHERPDSDKSEGEDSRGGNLHMYRTNRRINRLLYIDGMSAAKTNLGTLDTQDILLLNLTHDDSGRGMFGEMERAQKLCKWGKKYGIEGYIRTEAGIEIIWCDFEEGLDFLSHNQRPAMNSPEDVDDLRIFEYYRAMSARYHGITAGRVALDYSSMVSAFFYPMNLSNPDPDRAYLPRLQYPQDSELQVVKSDLEAVMARNSAESSVNWQGVVDMVVSRYATRLPFLARKATEHTFQSEINTLLNVFVEYNSTDIQAAISQCTYHYLLAATPSTREDFLILAALEEVSHKICETLFQARDLVLSDSGKDSGHPPPAAVEVIQELIDWLDWSTWKECGACDYDEVCVVAIWPFGTVKDHFNPSCQNSSQITDRRGEGRYW